MVGEELISPSGLKPTTGFHSTDMGVMAFKQTVIVLQSKQHTTVFLLFSLRLCVSEAPVPNCGSQSIQTIDPRCFVTPLVDTRCLINFNQLSIFIYYNIYDWIFGQKQEKTSGKYSSRFGYTQRSKIPRLTRSKRISYPDAPKHKR